MDRRFISHYFGDWPAIAALAAAMFFVAFALPAAAQPSHAAQDAVRAALVQWTADFNAGNTQKVCDLFSPDLLYDYPGYPERTYKDICDLLQRSLADRTKRYSYALAIKEILVSGDLAVVRLVWTLKVVRNNAPDVHTSVEPGMDLFRKQPDGSWKIIRYIAYELPG